MTYKDWNELRNAFIKLNNKIDEKICDWDVSQEFTHVWNLIDAQYELDKLETYLDADGNEIPNDFHLR